MACELADVELFSLSLELARYELEDLVLMRMQLERRTINGRLDLTRMLAPNDPKDVKKVRNRIVGVISARATETLKHNNFLKLKTPLKLQFESKMKEIAEYDYDSRIVGREKLPPVCINLLTAKYRRLLQVQLLKEYTNDLLLTASKQQVATENCALIGKLHIFGRALPFLSNLLILPN